MTSQVIPTGVVFEVAAAGPHDETCAVITSGAPLFTRGVASRMVHVQDERAGYDLVCSFLYRILVYLNSVANKCNINQCNNQVFPVSLGRKITAEKDKCVLTISCA